MRKRNLIQRLLFEVKCWLLDKVDVAWTCDEEGGVHDHYLRRWVFLLLVGLLALAAVSCAPTRKACEKNYGPCGVITSDTIFTTHIDTIVTERTVLPPTTFDPFGLALFDTLSFREGRFNAQIIRDTIVQRIKAPGDTIFSNRTDTVFRLTGGCDADTLYRTDTVWRERVSQQLFTPQHEPFSAFDMLKWAAIAIAIVGGIVITIRYGIKFIT